MSEPDLDSRPFKPGDHPDDYRYLFKGHGQVLTELERRAWMVLVMEKKHHGLGDHWMTRCWPRMRSDIAALIQEGETSFYAKTFARVLREQPEGLRTCPRCGSLCRTSEACLCPHCSHTWYEERAIII